MSPVSEGQVRPPFDPDATYTARRGPRYELVKEELELFQKLDAAVTRRTSLTASNEEREAAMRELLREDPEIVAMWGRLEELIAANDESAILALVELERKEEEEAED